MRVLLTGASGFIGRYLLANLIQAGHEVVPAVRDPEETDRLLPNPRSIFADFNRDVHVEDWLPRLRDIDAVVNCAGILQQRPGQSIHAVHADTPKALFAACKLADVRRVVQISATSAEKNANTAYASTKRAADDFLAATDLDWVILRPSLVYAEGAHGGTALFRALASLPFAIPLVGRGDQPFQPIHADDLAAVLVRILGTPSINRIVLDPVGPDRLTLRQILVDLRRWLGFSPARLIEIPMPMIALAARAGDLVGGTINTTALRQLAFGNAAPMEPFVAVVGVTPRRWRDALLARPAQPQDRWHARLYLLRPLLRGAIALTWIGSGIVGLIEPPVIERHFALLGARVPEPLFWSACLLDIVVGLAALLRWRTATLTIAQIALVAFYTMVLSIARPALWIDAFGPLLKNLPFAVAILVLAAIEIER